jgi:hypothetical protein
VILIGVELMIGLRISANSTEPQNEKCKFPKIDHQFLTVFFEFQACFLELCMLRKIQ